MKLNGRALPLRTNYFDVAPTHAVAPACAERFHAGFFGGEARGITFETGDFLFAIPDFAIGENAAQKTVPETLDALTDARNFGDVHTSADNHTDMLIANLQFGAIDQLSFDGPRIGRKLMRSRRAFRIDMSNFMAVGRKPIRDDHPMAAEVNALGTHVGSGRRVCHLDEFGSGALELRGQRVVRVVAKACVAQRSVRRIFAGSFSISAESLHPYVVNAVRGQRLFERLAIEMRQPSRHRESPDVD